MDPSADELATIGTDLQKAFAWAGIEDISALRTALGAALGGPTSLRQFAAIPLASYSRLVQDLKIPAHDSDPERALTPVEEGQAGAVRRAARAALGLATDENGTFFPVGMGAGPPAHGGPIGSAGPPATEQSKRVKLAHVLDQGDDSEVRPLEPARLRELIDKWKKNENDGEDPEEDEEATGDQLAALDFRLRGGATPYVDFAVWRPHGARLGRAMKFHAYVSTPEGGYRQKEFNGPSSFAEWEKSWKVYAYAMFVLGAASRFRLDSYRKCIAKLAEVYPETWWLTALADMRMRAEHLERIRRRCAQQHQVVTTAGLPSDFDPDRPWDKVYREAARDTEYWHEHVDRKALRFAARVQPKAALIDEGYGRLVAEGQAPPGFGRKSAAGHDDSGDDEAPRRKRRRRGTRHPGASGSVGAAATATPAGPAGKGSGKGKAKGKSKDVDAKTGDGRYFRDSAGVQLCWEWNRSVSGCADTCPNGRSHKCEWCRQAHRTVACRQGG